MTPSAAKEDRTYEEARNLLISNPSKFRTDYVRPKLDGLADSIIFCLFERARYRRNSGAYNAPNDSIPEDISLPNGRKARIPGFSFLDFLMLGMETSHAFAGRYKHPEEFPFFGAYLPEPAIPRNPKAPHFVPEVAQNVTGRIKRLYLGSILDKICRDGEDDELGSSAEWDIRFLQDMAKRVHLGFSVAESKFREDPKTYNSLVERNDFDKIRDKLRDMPRERELLDKIRKIGRVYLDEQKQDLAVDREDDRGQDKETRKRVYRIDPEIIVDLFEKDILPLTIDVQIDYFLKRVNFPIG